MKQINMKCYDRFRNIATGIRDRFSNRRNIPVRNRFPLPGCDVTYNLDMTSPAYANYTSDDLNSIFANIIVTSASDFKKTGNRIQGNVSGTIVSYRNTIQINNPIEIMKGFGDFPDVEIIEINNGSGITDWSLSEDLARSLPTLTGGQFKLRMPNAPITGTEFARILEGKGWTIIIES